MLAILREKQTKFGWILGLLLFSASPLVYIVRVVYKNICKFFSFINRNRRGIFIGWVLLTFKMCPFFQRLAFKLWLKHSVSYFTLLSFTGHDFINLFLVVSRVISLQLLPFIFIISELLNHVNVYTVFAFATHIINIHVSYFIVKVLGALFYMYNTTVALLQVAVINLASQLNYGWNHVLHTIINNDACMHKYGKLVVLLLIILLFFILESKKTIFFYKTPLVKTIQTPASLSTSLAYTIVVTTTATNIITSNIKLFLNSLRS